MTRSTSSTVDTAPPARRAVLFAIQLPHQSDAEVKASLKELEQLAEGLGIEVVDRAVQKRPTPGAPGIGKLRELSALTGGLGSLVPEPVSVPVDDLKLIDPLRPMTPDADDLPEIDPLADLVIVDHELGPADTRQMEQALGVDVIDRPGIILRVFETRAQTREARLETEIARLTYEAARVRDSEGHDDRQGGGGRGGRGHTNVELTKRRLRERARTLRRELDVLYEAQSARREKRTEAFGVALVGYTNAGKSTWMRALTGSDVLVKDQLFATLGTTVRMLEPETAPRILVSDTVGFIRNLPHALIASFRATLDEARHASLLLYIADASDPELDAQLRVTREVIGEIGAGDLPYLVVLNKIDRVSPERREELARTYPEAHQLSAHSEQDAGKLRELLSQFFEQRLVELTLEIPYAKLALVGRVHERARVLSESYTDAGAVLLVRGLRSTLAQITSALRDTA
jgi:GTP-binding protein HflX